MTSEPFFRGSGLAEVAANGVVRLPSGFLAALGARSDGGAIVLALHPRDACVTGTDCGGARRQAARIARLRRIEEEACLATERHHRRARREYGLAEDSTIDGEGRVLLPALLRRRAGIGRFALFVGTGDEFELWDPERARLQGGALADIAGFRLAEAHTEGDGG